MTAMLAPDEASVVEPTTSRAVLRNARAIAGPVASAAQAGEEARRLTPDMTDLLRRAGLFQMAFPRSRGGLEMTLAEQVTAVATVARADGGIGWNVGVLNATGYYAGRLGEQAYAELYPTRDMPTSGSFHPRGRADRVDGGYLVSGGWDWGSGSYSAEHIVGGALVFENDAPVIGPQGRQLVLGLWLPREAVQHAHNWQTLGVRASGSSSYSITDPVFVPEHHSFDREALPNPDQSALNKHVGLAFFGLSGVCMGLCQQAVDLTAASIRRRLAGAGADPMTSRFFGEAVSTTDDMVAAILGVAQLTDEAIFTPGRLLTPVEESRMTAANVTAAQALGKVVDICLDLYGSRYIFDSDPMQRLLRDADSAVAHVGAKRMHWGPLGANALADPSTPTSLLDQWLTRY